LRLCAFARGNLYTPAPFTTAASLPIHSSWLRVVSLKGEKAQSFLESRNPDSFGKPYIGDCHIPKALGPLDEVNLKVSWSDGWCDVRFL